jgi:gentisate 1,2-dioxygenase
MIWMDVLDLPVVAALDAVFFEIGEEGDGRTRTDPASASERWFGAGPGLRPVAGPELPEHRSPLLAYRWARTDWALEAQLDVTGGVHARLRYTDPVRGGDVMPTMRCEMDRVRAGHVTVPERQTGGRVACVLAGTGRLLLDEGTLDLAPGDVIALPSWTWWSIEADDQIDLFSTSDAPVLEALGLMRAESRRPGER